MDGYISIGKAAQSCGVSIRTLQYYDSIGLLAAHRGPRNTRWYAPEDLATLQQIIFMRELDLPLEEIQRRLEEHSPITSFEAQLELLDAEEARVRGRRAVLAAIVAVQRRLPEAELPLEILESLMAPSGEQLTFEDWLRQHPDLLQGELAAEDAMSLQLAWKGLAARALILAHNGVSPQSEIGRELGAEMLRLIGSAPRDLLDVLRPILERQEEWPEVTRVLYERTESYLYAAANAANAEHSPSSPTPPAPSPSSPSPS